MATTRTIDRLLSCTSNCLLFIACLHDLFIVKYRHDSHLISRGFFLVILILYLALLFLARLLPHLFQTIFTLINAFLLTFSLSLSTYSFVLNTISNSSNVLLYEFLLTISALCSVFAVFIRSLTTLTDSSFHFLHQTEFVELFGYACGLFILGQSSSLYWLLISFALLIVTIRLRALHAFLLLILVLIYFYSYFIPYSYVACSCFLVRLLVRPIIELYFISLTSLERWILLLHFSSPYRKSLQRLMIFIYCLVPLISIILIGQTVRFHDEWFIIVPLYLLIGLLWSIFHLLTFSLLWMISNKLIECYLTMMKSNLDNHNRTDEEIRRVSFTKLMASKGVRYFGLIAWPILVCSTMLTLFLGLLHYDTRTHHSLALLILTINLECLVLALVKQLTSIVGGSCVGYALVAPAFETPDDGLFSSSIRTVQILTQQEANDSGQRCTNILNGLHRFMATNFIENFGCDYSSSGITMHFINTKLTTFFSKRTEDGRRYDTYLFYYSGPTRENGDLALADNQTVSLNLLLQWWCENESSSSSLSRLIIVCDTFNSYKWLKQIRCQTFNNSCKPSIFLVLQTFNRRKKMPKLIELGQNQLGVFTEIWLKLNTSTDASATTSIDASASWRANHLEPKCSFSYYYPEFNFRQPTNADVDRYLNEHPFLQRLHLIYHLLTYLPSLFIFPFLYVFNCLKRWRFHLLVPRVIDTYHGFKLFVR